MESTKTITNDAVKTNLVVIIVTLSNIGTYYHHTIRSILTIMNDVKIVRIGC